MHEVRVWPVAIALLIETKGGAWVSTARAVCAHRGEGQGFKSRVSGTRASTPCTAFSAPHQPSWPFLPVLLAKLPKWVKVGVESFGMRPFTPFPSVNPRMTTDSVIQNWSRNTVQTSFG